ncbi:DUF2975 domain-containing protein [Staphylospora marina]|uniref:DUF2975 domain-containing protein n=1 Tax=Staphylospora marina TaxID=2490858 RepID=UPI003B9695F5
MNRDQGSTLFLKSVIVLLGLGILTLCVVFYLGIEGASDSEREYVFLHILLGIFYLSAIPFYMALYQAFKLLQYIDRNEAFSELSVTALKKIKHYAFSISMLYVLSLPLFYYVAEKDDAPGMLLIGLLLAFAAMVVSVFAAVLQKLLKSAVEIKAEHDLTI